MLDHSCQVQRAPLVDRKDDLYETPDVAVHALLRQKEIGLPHRIWECAAGPGRIVKVLRAAGHEVLGSDLVDYGEPTHFSGRDFLMERACPPGTGAIVTNPPFKLATEFAEHAVELCPLVVMLLRLAFLESKRRAALIDRLSRVYVFDRRLPMMHRAGWEGRKANSGMAFAWMVWDRSHRGPTELHRISWDAK